MSVLLKSKFKCPKESGEIASCDFCPHAEECVIEVLEEVLDIP